MQKVFNLMAAFSFLVSGASVAGAWYLYKNADVMIEQAREKAVEEIAAIGFDDLELTNIQEECKENVRNWFDAYMQSNTGDIDVNVSKWFTSYMMKCAREGTPITVSDRDAYREVTNLVD